MATKVEAARLLMLKAARFEGSGKRLDVEAGMAKLFASETGKEVVEDSFRIHGGYGYSKEYEIERLYRDAPLLLIGEGTSEIQRMVIGRKLIAQEQGMSVQVLHSHAVDSLLKAHRSDAARLPALATSRYTREEIIAAIKRWQDHYGYRSASNGLVWVSARRGLARRALRGRRPADGSRCRFSPPVRQHEQGAVRRGRAAPARPHPRALAHALGRLCTRTAIREWTELYSEPPAIADWSPARARSAWQLWRLDRYYAGNWPSTNTVVRRFGTFSAAVRKAGLEPRPRGRHTGAAPSIPIDAREIIRRQLDADNLSGGLAGPSRR